MKPTFSTVHAAVAAADPASPALIQGDRRMTYGELDTAANRLAHLLIADGVRRGDRVAVHVPRTPEMIVALLAALKAGAAYLPADPAFPAARVRELCGHARVTVTAATLEDPRLAGAPAHDPGVPVGPADAACVLFTSGSTGRPKGAVGDHRSILRTFLGQDYLDFGPRHVTLQAAPVSWDAFALELFPALLHGGTCVLQPGQSPDPALIAELVRRHGVTSLFLSAGLFALMADLHPDVFGRVEQVITGGDVPVLSALHQVRRDNPRLRIVNGYGPVESMVVASCHRMTVADLRAVTLPIGVPLAYTSVHLLDDTLRPVPDGTSGELYIGGDGLAQGYLGQPAVTATRFVAGPGGTRLYRTGDLAARRPDGVLEFLGRADDQVKVRGFRIEPGEIEAVLAAHPGVTEAKAVARQDSPGDKRLVGYLTGAGLTPQELREYVAARLPEHLVPSAFVVLDALPRTANGKLDRAALPAPQYGVNAAHRAPASLAEASLCAMFGEVLGVPGVGVDDHFFHLGGHSLLAARLINRIRSTFGAELTLRDLFAAPTVAAVATLLGSGREHRPVLRARTRIQGADMIPLSFAQQRLWFLSRLEHSPAYNVPIAVDLRGRVDTAALRAALTDVVDRHEALRTVFPESDGVPFQHIVEDAGLAWTELECAAEDLDRVVAEESRYVFDLTRELPVRVTLLRAAADHYVLLVVMHHIVSDGWSMSPLLRDVATAYDARSAGTSPAWEPLPVQYADYTVWQQELLGDPSEADSMAARQLEFWRKTLDALPEEVTLAPDHSRPATPSYRGDVVSLQFDVGTHAALHELARRHQVTLFMILQAALAGTLSRLGTGHDIVFGSPVAGRVDDALEDLVGFFVNTLVLRTSTSGDPTFTELLDRVRDTDLAAYAHQDLPFERIVEALNPSRSLARHPLFQVMLVLQNNDEAALDLPDLEVSSRLAGTGTAKFDLTVAFSEIRNPQGELAGIGGSFEFATDLYDRRTVEVVARSMERIVRAMVADTGTRLSAVDLLPAQERRLLLEDWSGAATPVTAHDTAHAVFARQAALHPDVVAIIDGADRLTYRQLDVRADQLAQHLIATGVGRGELVGIRLDRGAELVVAVLGVLKAGAAYTLLDTKYPADRLQSIVDGAGIRRVLRGADLTAAKDSPGTAPAVEVTPDDVVCVMFTSGSTGRPKGVVASHRSLVATFAGQDYVRTGPGEVVLQCSPVSWDAFALELFAALLFGGTCVLQPGQSPEPAVIADLVARHRVSTMHVSASLLNFLIDEYPAVFDGVRQVMTGGEAASKAHLAKLLARWPDLRLVNGYSPVECMIFTVYHAVSAADTASPRSVPVGRPLRGKRVYVLDEHLNPAPIGVAGELYMAGAGVAHGYLGQPGLTAQRFVADPFKGGRMYRTGDLVKWRADGILEFCGRIDDQVKIRGFRIEPAEVEAAVAAHAAVTQVAVVVREDRPGDKRLVAYIVPAEALDTAELRRRLGTVLPDYMVPTAFVTLDALPRTANGKLDRKALPAPEVTASAAGRRPRNTREELLCGLYTEILGVQGVGIDDDFFDLGGHSLLVTRLISKVRKACNVELTIQTVFSARTVAHLVEQLDNADKARPALRARSRAELAR